MKTTSIITILFLFFSVGQLMSQPATSYQEEIERNRAVKDSLFRIAAISPLPADSIPTFEGLKYFDIDTNFIFNGSFKPDPREPMVDLETTDGSTIQLVLKGAVTFNVNGKTQTLKVFKGSDQLPEFKNNPDQLFIPFNDPTNGASTNDNGRYLNVTPDAGHTMTLDFNNGYNPFSHYDAGLTGIIPPAENRVMKMITTGERKYEDY